MGMNATALVIDLLGGIALLLWGVRMVRTGMTRAFGARLRRVLGHATRNRFTAFSAGIGVTALLQSATATALLVASFAGRGLIGATAALAVMLGADLGTTLAAQLFSLNLHWVGPLALVAGVGLFLSGDSGSRRHIGRLLIGFGLLFLALKLIVSASAPLRDAPAFIAVLAPLAQEPLLAIMLAALLTWAAHSSLAIVLTIAGLASTGALPPVLALSLVLGANLGGGIAPLTGTAGQPASARRAPLGNLIMRGIGVLIALPLIDPLLGWLLAFGPESRLAVNAHTAFNLALAVLFLPLLPLVERLCRRLMPDAATAETLAAPRYLDEGALDTPSVALAAAARETLRLSDIVSGMLNDAMTVFRTDDARLAKAVEQADNQVDRLHESIKLYLTELSKHEMDSAESRRHVDVLTFTTNLEHIGDIIDKNLMELAAKKIKHKLAFSAEGLHELTEFHARVAANLQMACNVFMANDAKLARQLLREKTALREAERQAAENHYRRLAQGRAESIETSAIHLDVIRDLKRINSHLTAVVYPILEQTGELTASRLKSGEAAPAGNGKPSPA